MTTISTTKKFAAASAIAGSLGLAALCLGTGLAQADTSTAGISADTSSSSTTSGSSKVATRLPSSAAAVSNFKSNYNYGAIAEPRIPAGSNANALLKPDMDVTDNGVDTQTWESLKQQGKVNTQVLTVSTVPVTVTPPTILQRTTPYGD
jgi:hypothetical protein